MVAITTVQPAGLPMNHVLVVAVGRTLPAIFASWRTTVWVTLAFYLLVGMVVVFGLRVMQQNLRSQEQSLLDKDQALSNLWHAVLIATGQGVWDANLQTEQVVSFLGLESPIGLRGCADWQHLCRMDDAHPPRRCGAHQSGLGGV